MNACRVGTTAILIVPLSRAFGLVGVALAVATGIFATIPIAVRAMNSRQRRRW
jgi:O-antigen/teichoic acid export membrane protein